MSQEPPIIFTQSGVTMLGLCSAKLNGCTAIDPAGPVHAIHVDGGPQVNICGNCLKQKVDSGEWQRKPDKP